MIALVYPRLFETGLSRGEELGKTLSLMDWDDPLPKVLSTRRRPFRTSVSYIQ